MNYDAHQLQSMQAQLKSGTPLAGVVVPAPKSRRRNLESECQRALVTWWREACKGFAVPECCLFSIPNGGNWSAKRGSIMKAEGQRKGACDLFLAAGTARFHGLFLELKTPTGVVSLDQQLFIEYVRSQGYDAHVARSLEDAKEVITNYLMT